MLTLYHSPQSRSTRMLWLMEEIGEPYDVKYVTIRRGDGSSERDPKNPHPEGKVPALMHDDKLITESGAICLYLTDTFPKSGIGAGPNDPKRGDYLFWLFNYIADLEPILIARMTGAGDNPFMKRGYEQTIERFTKALKAGDYLVGNKFTAVDLLWGSAVQWMRDQFPADALFDRYVERLSTRPAAIRGNAKDKV